MPLLMLVDVVLMLLPMLPPLPACFFGLLVSHRPGHTRSEYMGCLATTATAITPEERGSTCRARALLCFRFSSLFERGVSRP